MMKKKKKNSKAAKQLTVIFLCHVFNCSVFSSQDLMLKFSKFYYYNNFYTRQRRKSNKASDKQNPHINLFQYFEFQRKFAEI